MKQISNSFRRLTGLAISLAILSPTLSWGQASSSVSLPITAQNLRMQTDGSAQMDLLAELKKARPALATAVIEIQMLRVEAKTNIGGAQVFLKLNNEFTASAVIETDADLFFTEDVRAYERIELRNIDRARINTGILQIQNAANVKVKSIEVILGAVQEPTVFGHYAQVQADVVGGSSLDDDRDMRPTDEAIAAIYGTYYGADEASILAQEQAQLAAAEKQAREDANNVQAIELRNSLASGLSRAQSGSEYEVSSYLRQARTYYDQQKAVVGYGQKILLEEEVLAYIARLESLYNTKLVAGQNAERERIRAAELAAQEKARLDAMRPSVNYYAKDKCIKAKKKKIGNKKEFCIGEYVAGIWPQHNPPQIIDLNAQTRMLTFLFDYSPVPTVMSVDAIPNQP